MISPRVGTVVLFLVGTVWGLSSVLGMVSAVTGAFEYRPDLETHGIFSLVLTAVFTVKRRDGDDAPRGGGHRR